MTPKKKSKNVVGVFLVFYRWKEQVKILVQEEWDKFRRESGKNNAYDHLMLESSPSRSNTCDVPRIICDDDPIEADGVKPRDKTCCFLDCIVLAKFLVKSKTEKPTFF